MHFDVLHLHWSLRSIAVLSHGCQSKPASNQCTKTPMFLCICRDQCAFATELWPATSENLRVWSLVGGFRFHSWQPQDRRSTSCHRHCMRMQVMFLITTRPAGISTSEICTLSRDWQRLGCGWDDAQPSRGIHWNALNAPVNVASQREHQAP